MSDLPDLHVFLYVHTGLGAELYPWAVPRHKTNVFRLSKDLCFKVNDENPSYDSKFFSGDKIPAIDVNLHE